MRASNLNGAHFLRHCTIHTELSIPVCAACPCVCADFKCNISTYLCCVRFCGVWLKDLEGMLYQTYFYSL